jgi:hypothetical protein
MKPKNMKTNPWLVWVAVGFLGLSAAVGCGGSSDDGEESGSGTESGEGGSGQPKPGEIPDLTGVIGHVRDALGAPVVGAKVSGGSAEAVTDAEGYFELEVNMSGETVFRATSAGFLPGLRRLAVGQDKPNAVEFTLYPMAEAVVLNAEAGGEVTAARGAALTAPAGAFVDATGNPVTGEVSVHLTPLDPSVEAELAAYPGDLRATTAEGETVQLESFGVLDVTVMQGENKLDVAPDQKLTIRVPAPASGTTPPDTIALWSFDEETGLWGEEGTATLDQASGTYVAEIAHMSFWNCDQPLSSTCVRGTIEDSAGNPVPGAWVSSEGVDYNGGSQANASADGSFCMAVRRNSTVRVTAIHPAGGGQTKEIASGDTISPVPPICDDTCLDIGEFVIETGVVSGPGGTTNCADVGNPFEDTCASGFGTIGECFQPTGSCTVGLGGVEWENGARVENDLSNLDPETGIGAKGRLYGASGELCATYTVIGISASGGANISYEVNGENYRFEYFENGDLKITCPSGESVTMTEEQRTVFDACYAGDSGGDGGAQCAVSGLEGGGEGGGGGVGSTCSEDSDCSDGLECCSTQGISVCVPEGVCP